ncbi:MAG: ribosome biogenesis GTPase Der [Deltaproteobacteria bacterium]|nr:ribosome biogenesis GTPase Der [Deltaproteobacteria bacterium]
MKPIVALVGRPNVGKSTLFNRIIGKRRAITFDIPGVTRDRHYGTAFWEGRDFICVDTGGFPQSSKGASPTGVHKKIEEQIAIAIEEAAVIVLVVDAQDGLTSVDQTIATRLRKSGTHFIVAVNKVDLPIHEEKKTEFYRLGTDEVYTLSAEHGTAMGDFMDQLVKRLPPEKMAAEEKADIKIALAGRPNVGKSSLLNRLCGSPRAVVDEVAGTTRDVIDTLVTLNEKRYLLLDTAGIRRKGKSDTMLERTCVLLAERAIHRADICLLLLDAGEGLSRQEAHIAGFVGENTRGLIILVNKWDLPIKVKGSEESYRKKIRQAFKFAPYAPILFVSAKSGLGVPQIWKEIDAVYAEFSRELEPSLLQEILLAALEAHPPPIYGAYPLAFHSVRQVGHCPPTLLIIIDRPKGLHFSMERYLISQFRKGLGLEKGPLRIIFRKGKKEEEAEEV